MFDLATLSALAASAVSALAPLLQKTLEKGAEEAGKAVAGSAIDSLKKRLAHKGTKEALDDLAQEPDSNAAQGALEMQLRKAIQADPELAVFIQKWLEAVRPESGVSQTSNVAGENNKVVQIAGSGNWVG